MAASRSWRRHSVVAVLLGILVVGGARAAQANPNELSLEVVRDQATVAPDGRSITFGLTIQCDRRATVLEARISAVQPQASGEGTFTPICNRIPTFVQVTVPSTGGSFQTGAVQVGASLVVRSGRTKQAQDSALLRARPSVSVLLADRAVVEGAGEAVRIDVTLTCPVAGNGQGGLVQIYQDQVIGSGAIAPTVCDGIPHKQSVRVATSGRPFQPGPAQAAASATVEEGGDLFPGGDFRNIQIT